MSKEYEGFQKISTDDHVTVFRHPKGHEVKVAHKALSEKMRKDLEGIPGMAEGGVVKPLDRAKELYNIKTALDAPVANSIIGGTDFSEGDFISSTEAPAFMSPERWQLAKATAGAELDQQLESKDKAAGRAQEQASLKAELSGAAPAGPLPASTGPTQAGLPQLASQPQSQAAASTSSSNQYMRGLNKEISGIREQARGEQELERAKLGVEEQNIADQQNAMNSYQQSIGKLEAERSALEQDIQSSHVDPDRYISSMSTGQRILTGIGLALSGLGAGGAGQENLAHRFLQQQIDNDVKAQQADLGKKENLLSANMKKFDNLRQALDATRIMQTDLAAAKIRQIAAKSADPLIKARATQLEGHLLRESAQAASQFAASSALNAQLRSGSMRPEQIIRAKITDDGDRKRALEEVEMVSSYKQAARNVNDLFADAAKIGVVGANLPFSESKAKLAALRSQITSVIRQGMKGQGTITDQDQKLLIDPNLPNGSDTEAQVRVKLNSIQNTLRNRVSNGTPTLSGYGIPADLGQPTMTTQQERLLNGAKAALQKNPNDKVALAVMEKLGGR